MEYVFIGLALAIGFYLAPIVMVSIVAIGVGICRLFGGCKY